MAVGGALALGPATVVAAQEPPAAACNEGTATAHESVPHTDAPGTHVAHQTIPEC